MIRSSFLSSWVAQLLGRAVSVAASVLSVALLSRHLGVEGFGMWTAVAAWTSLAGPLADLGLPAVILRDAQDETFDDEVGAALGLQLVLSAPAAILATVSGALVLNGSQDAFVSLVIASFSLIPTASYLLLQLAFARSGRFVSTALVEAGARLATALVTVFFVSAGLSLPWLFVLLCLPPVFGLGGLLAVSRRVRLRIPRARLDRARWRDLLRRGLPVAASLGLFAVYLRLDVVLLTLLTDKSSVGVYGLAYRIVEVVLAVPTLFLVVAYPRLVAVKDEPGQLSRLVGRCCEVLAVCAGPVVIVALCASPMLMALLGGEEFRHGGRALALLLVSAALSFGTGLFGQLLIILGQPGFLFRFSAVNVVCNLLLNLFLIRRFGVAGAAASTVVTELLAFLIVGARLRGQGVLASQARLLTVVAFAVVISLAGFVVTRGAGTVIGLLVAALAYLGTIMATRVISAQRFLELGNHRA